MGIFLDTVEDNAESEGWRVESIRQKLRIPTSTPQQFPAVSCPLCPQLFFSDTELQDHIFYAHRDYCGYFSINGLILHEGSHFKERDIRELNYADLDDIVFNLQTRIDKGKRIADWAKYKTPLHQSNEHPLRKQYLTGMLEYLGAHYQEVIDQSSNYQSLSEQFGRAYGYLQPFPFHLAQQTRRSIALKMNWFRQVGDAPENSLFFWTSHFFERHKHLMSRSNSQRSRSPKASNPVKANSVVAAFNGRELTPFVDQNNLPHPSVVWYRGDSKAIVGRDAKDRIKDFENTPGNKFIRSIKSQIPKEEEFEIFGKPYYTLQVGSEIFRFLKEDVKHRYKNYPDITEAVVTVPLYFNWRQRRAIRKAAGRAGITIKTFIHEPFAAVVGYLFADPNQREALKQRRENILVFDWGVVR